MGFAPKIRFAPDSPLEGDGFEPSVPHKKQPFLAAPVRSRNSPSATKPALSCRGPMVRIHLPPAESQVRTCLSREFALLRREAAVSAGVRAGASGAVGRDARGAATSCL